MAADALAPHVARTSAKCNVKYVDTALTWGRILSTCVISMWSNDIKCRYVFMFPLQNLAPKELILTSFMMMVPSMASLRSVRSMRTTLMTFCMRSISWRRKMFRGWRIPILFRRSFTCKGKQKHEPFAVVVYLSPLWISLFHWLTLVMPNCFKNYKRCIHTLNCILDLAWPK